jgi:membrane-bound lytic murein transglycosylase D
VGYPAPAGYPPPHAWAGYGPTYAPAHPGAPLAAGAPAGASGNLLGTTESPRLARLREEGGQSSCKLGPTQSMPPTYASFDGEPEEEIDDLDAAAKEALSRLQLPDFAVAISRRALKYVRFLTRTERGRGLFTSWMKRSGRYQDMVQQTLREWRLPEDLIWVAMIESGFDARAKSPAGAMGLWQFMRGTGEVYSLEVSRYHDERMNPVKATRAASHHLRDLFQRFGSWELAFAAYNMGYEQLLDRIDRYGTTDFNELARQRALPSETASYVPKIVAAALVANNLDRYGFEDVKIYKPLHHAELSVPGGTHLSTVAKAAGTSSTELRNLNPHLLKPYVPPTGDYTVFIPPDTLSRAHAALPAMLDRKVTVTDRDILLPDDLDGMAASKGSRLRDNDWTEDENLLRFLPRPKRRSMRSVLTGREQDDPVADLAEEFVTRRSGRETVMYRVGSGDTLIGVARQFAIDVDDLASENGLDVDEKLQEGSLLKLSVKPVMLKRWKRAADDGPRRRQADGQAKARKGKSDS